MQTVFIRHNLDSTPEILKYLWDERLIAIHFEDLHSTSPADYGSAGQQALKRLKRYCNSGAVVGATFHKIKSTQILVGEIEPGSKIEAFETHTLFGNTHFIYKVVKLKNAQEVSYDKYPLLSAIQPRQATITGWPSAGKCLQAILNKQKPDWEVESLTPGQLEVMCYEFLRMRGILKALLLPIGRGRMDIDIDGLGENDEHILAQVTGSRNLKVNKYKLARLKEYQSENSRLFFFTPVISKIDDPAIRFISIEEAFLALSEDQDIYRRMISAMLNW